MHLLQKLDDSTKVPVGAIPRDDACQIKRRSALVIFQTWVSSQFQQQANSLSVIGYRSSMQSREPRIMSFTHTVDIETTVHEVPENGSCLLGVQHIHNVLSASLAIKLMHIRIIRMKQK